MVINKSKKVKKYRGSKTHGCGSMKKRRGAGNRGGRGNAGSGKRGDAKKPSVWKQKYFGKKGFIKKNTGGRINIWNLKDLEEKYDYYVQKKLITLEGDNYIVDAKKLGFDKLLGKGKITKKFKITVSYASKKAIERVKKAGGQVNGLVNEITFDKKEKVTQE